MLTLLLACSPAPILLGTPEVPKDDTGVSTTDDSPADDSGADDTSDSVEDTGAVEEVPLDFDWDCDNVPDFNLGDTTMSNARGYHGLAFDDDGHIIGWDTRSSLIKATYDGSRDAWIPGQSAVEQLARHPNGTIYMARADEGAVFAIDTDGAVDRIAGSMPGIYGVTIAPDGNLFIADNTVRKINVETGENALVLSGPEDGNWRAHATGLSLDSRTLYVGTVGDGTLLAVPLDEDLRPSGPAEVFANLGGAWMDAVGVDACGYLWVPDYYSSSLYRISPEGEVQSMVVAARNTYGHGVVWGRGHGGWRQDAIYLPQPYNNNTVREVIIGVPDGRHVRTWNGVQVNY